MKKSSKTEIVIPTWAGRTGYSYWGDHDYGSYDNHNSSFWVSLRGVVPNDKYSYMNDDCRAICDIGLYVYVSTDKTISIDLRLHDVGSLTLYEAEQRIKTLKRLFVKGKEYKFNSFSHDSDVHSEMTKVVDALGIKRAMVYHGVGVSETFVPIGIAIKGVSDCIEKRLNDMRLREAA
jgi:hypothetical protein